MKQLTHSKDQPLQAGDYVALRLLRLIAKERKAVPLVHSAEYSRAALYYADVIIDNKDGDAFLNALELEEAAERAAYHNGTLPIQEYQRRLDKLKEDITAHNKELEELREWKRLKKEQADAYCAETRKKATEDWWRLPDRIAQQERMHELFTPPKKIIAWDTWRKQTPSDSALMERPSPNTLKWWRAVEEKVPEACQFISSEE